MLFESCPVIGGQGGECFGRDEQFVGSLCCKYRFRAGLNLKEIHKQKLKGVLHPSIVRASSVLTKRRSSLNFAWIGRCQKRRWHYFSILRGVCFLTFFDTSKAISVVFTRTLCKTRSHGWASDGNIM